MEAEGGFVLQSGGRCRYARVRVRYLGEPPTGPSGQRAELAAELRESGKWYPRMLEAALAGAAVGLESSGALGRCVVTGLIDPAEVPPSVITPGAIAIAAMRAAWAAAGFVADEDTARRAEAACGERLGAGY